MPSQRVSEPGLPEQASKSPNDTETVAINISFEHRVMSDDDTELSDVPVARPQMECVNAVCG